MALIKFGALVAEARGKEGGMVFSRNKGGAYVKVKVTPTNPQTFYQAQQRGAMGSVSQSWRALTQAQRDAWGVFAQGAPVTNIFGDQVFLSGFGAFCKCNRNLRLLGLATLTTPAAISAFGNFTALAVTSASGVITATWTISGNAAGIRFFYDATPGLPAGKKFVKNYYRLILADSAAPISPKVLTTVYVARFGAAPLVGQRMNLRIRQVDNVSGWDTFPVEVTTIAT
jgi:hypothetical protein